MKRLLKTHEAAEYVGLSKNFIWNEIAAGRFPYINISRGKKPAYRFDVKELDKWIEERSTVQAV